jgi:hypothetical protein
MNWKGTIFSTVLMMMRSVSGRYLSWGTESLCQCTAVLSGELGVRSNPIIICANVGGIGSAQDFRSDRATWKCVLLCQSSYPPTDVVLPIPHPRSFSISSPYITVILTSLHSYNHAQANTAFINTAHCIPLCAIIMIDIRVFLRLKPPASLPHALAAIYDKYSAITATVAASQRH